MSRYDHADEDDIWRAMVVDEFGAVSWDEFLRRRKRRD
jgi:hypothetical protein